MMPNENVRLKPSEKITIILNKLPIGEAIEVYNKIGEDLHKRIDDDRKKLNEHESKLKNKNGNTQAS